MVSEFAMFAYAIIILDVQCSFFIVCFHTVHGLIELIMHYV